MMIYSINLHINSLLTYANPFWQSKIVVNNRKICPKKHTEKNGKKNFNNDIGHKMLNFLFFTLYDIIITNIVIRYIKTITIFTKIKYI